MVVGVSGKYELLVQKVCLTLNLSLNGCLSVNIHYTIANIIRFIVIKRTIQASMDRNIEGTELTQINRRRSGSVQSERTRAPPLRTMSEASVYRANSRQRISVKSGFTQNNKTLDRLMECFWTCSPGCHETP